LCKRKGESASTREKLGDTNASAQQYRARLLAAGMVAAVRRGELSFTLPWLGAYLRGEPL